MSHVPVPLRQVKFFTKVAAGGQKRRKTPFLGPKYAFFAHMTPLKRKFSDFFFSRAFYISKEVSVQWHNLNSNFEPTKPNLIHFLPTWSDLRSEKGVTYDKSDRILRFSDWCPFQFQLIVILMIFGDVWGGLGA